MGWAVARDPQRPDDLFMGDGCNPTLNLPLTYFDSCRQEQQQRVIRRCLKAEVPVVPCRLLIQRIDEQANPACLSVDALRTCQGIDQQ